MKFFYLLSISASLLVVQAGAADFQQLPTHVGGFGTDGSFISVADDFRFNQNTLVGSINWWGGYFNPPPGLDNFTVSLFSDGGGQPGVLLERINFGAVAGAATGQFVNAPDYYPEFKYSVTLPQPFLAQAGTTYWLSVVDPPVDVWLWEASGDLQTYGVQRSFDGGPWQPFRADAAFELATTPEPGTALISATGLVGMIFFSRKRNVSA